MTGIMTSYFPRDIPLSKVLEDTDQMLHIISEEMTSTTWTGVTVSYNNEPIPPESIVKEAEGENNSSRFPAGAVVGIVLAALAAVFLYCTLRGYCLTCGTIEKSHGIRRKY